MLARRAGSAAAAGSGTGPVIGHAVLGAGAPGHHRRDAEASSCTSRSKLASASEGAPRQSASARSQCAPCGASGRPGEILVRRVVGRHQAGARARLDRHVADGHARFHRERARPPGPRTRSRSRCRRRRRCVAMMARIDVLGGDAGPEPAVDPDAHAPAACRCQRVCVASTCSTSEAPMPKARAPNAPCVAVWRVAAHQRDARQRRAPAPARSRGRCPGADPPAREA